ncbi:diguanylate phosphodiesterase [Aestuariibacter sp. GS-14]|uniref:diguanylate phosphodiesterase n=1 Tax=Aestuariibacter sp. GS-14 TaxID=2590670 RepID=UPI00112A4CB3|nr:diguanylate phosphodiesterase [Aestuariibacter sp. GS-14]TPV57872.1 diguanylate phosphodiesterase [Aestuariibacter sp. GS-14]
MLRQLVYRSRATQKMSEQDIDKIVDDSVPFNKANNITGLLLFDGEFFFQVLEGEGETVHGLFEHIKSDPRHTNVVKVVDSACAQREFGKWHLRTLILNPDNQCYWLPQDLTVRRDSRVFSLLNSFATGRWRSCVSAEDKASVNCIIATSAITLAPYPASQIQFAFQPIVDTRIGGISSYEALLRNQDGTYPELILAGLPEQQRYEFDLNSKAIAITQGAKLLQPGQSLSVNLLPGAITQNKQVVDQLLRYLKEGGLRPEQLILEITESEMVKESDAFFAVIESIRATGIRLSLDDFGAGYAGLSLLADLMPDKIKLDRAITNGIHESGPRQAILHSVFEFANATGSHLIVEGVESFEEWLWLNNTGVRKFQGFLFARPQLNGTQAIHFNARALINQLQD